MGPNWKFKIRRQTPSLGGKINMNGKGSKSRPKSVTEDKFSENWDKIFKKKKTNESSKKSTLLLKKKIIKNLNQ